MMQSISHWGQFEMQASGTENFRDHLLTNKKKAVMAIKRLIEAADDPRYDAKYLHKFY